jgi:NADH-quinone oxidoreductase subunit A
MLTEFGRVLLFLIVGAGFVAIGMAIAWLLRPHRPYPSKLATYECGESPLGDTRIRFNIRFYIVALVFVLFDVEIVFLFPWATVYRQLGWFAFIEMVIFIAILLVGYAYVWRKGDLEWDKPAPAVPRFEPGTGVLEPQVPVDDEATI